MSSDPNYQWEDLLDIDDSDLPLTPVLCPFNRHVRETITITSTKNTNGIVQVEEVEKKPVRIIPGPTGIVQLAKIRKQSYIHEGGDDSILSTQDDLKVTVKDLSGTLAGSIHYKVINEGGYGKEITIGSAIILANVLVFSLKLSMHYLNITKKNMVKVFHKDFVPGNGSGVGGSGMLMEEEEIVKLVEEEEMADLELHVSEGGGALGALRANKAITHPVIAIFLYHLGAMKATSALEVDAMRALDLVEVEAIRALNLVEVEAVRALDLVEVGAVGSLSSSSSLEI
ncbi:reverse transcriptase zinc-binding domain-containing protein [Tanacetum coccineum]